MKKLEKTNILKCPSCGYNLVYDPKKRGLSCTHCGYDKPIDNKILNDERLLKEAKIHNTDWSLETRVFECSNCGAKTVFEPTQIAKACPFCSSSNVITVDDLPGMQPSSIIPFDKSEEDINNIYKNWLKKKFFVPTKIKKEIPKGHVHGVYLPCYTFDMDTVSTYTGRLGKYYTRTVGSGKNARTVTEIRYFNIHGVEPYKFDDVLVNAGNKIEQVYLDKVQPFKTNLGFEYKIDYIAGFSAEHYSKDLDQGYEDSKKIVRPLIERNILSNYNYDVVSTLHINTEYDNITYKYVLIPVWFLHYKYKEKEYKVVFNGDTGKLTGKYPISPFKVLLVVMIFLIIISGFLIWFLARQNSSPENPFINDFLTFLY